MADDELERPRAFVANAADPEQVKEGRRKVRQQQQRELDRLARLMRTPDGAAYFRTQLEAAGVFRSIYSTEPLEMAFREGQRNAGLQLLTNLALADPATAAQILLATLSPTDPSAP